MRIFAISEYPFGEADIGTPNRECFFIDKDIILWYTFIKKKVTLAMTINEICNILRSEFVGNGYEYGFYLEGKRYMPDSSLGFDEDYFRLSKTIYRVQNPIDTQREKIGTCIDACMLIKQMLNELLINCNIWLIRHREKGSVHTIITFEMDNSIVHLELTPRSKKPWYGKEILYSSVNDFLTDVEKHGYDISDVTNDITIGNAPVFLLKHLK